MYKIDNQCSARTIFVEATITKLCNCLTPSPLLFRKLHRTTLFPMLHSPGCRMQTDQFIISIDKIQMAMYTHGVIVSSKRRQGQSRSALRMS